MFSVISLRVPTGKSSLTDDYGLYLADDACEGFADRGRRCTTWMPAAVSAFILSAAVPWPPEMMAPAWPMRRPGGAVWPAMKPTTGFFTCCLDVCGGGFFGGAADLADEDDGFGLGIFVEQLERVDVRGADDGVAADADGGRLADAALRELVDGLVGERAGARDDADRAFLVNAAGHDADLGLAGRDDAGAVGADEPRLGVLELRPDLAPCRSIGMPSVMQMMSGMPASSASRMASAANGGGTKIMVALAPVFSTASATVLKTGQPSWVVPPLPGVTPPTTLVPYSAQPLAWKVPSLPVMP